MLKFGNKEFRNLEEQVLKNQQDISKALAGVKVDRVLTTQEDLENYTNENNLGKYYLVGYQVPYALYLISKYASSNIVDAVYLGEFPFGEQGPKGEKGDKGDKGDSIRGPRGYQGLQGAPGRGVDSLSAIDSTDYEATYAIDDRIIPDTESDDPEATTTDPDYSQVTVTTSADVEFGADPSKKIDFNIQYIIPKNFYTKEETDQKCLDAENNAKGSANNFTMDAIAQVEDNLEDQVDHILDAFVEEFSEQAQQVLEDVNERMDGLEDEMEQVESLLNTFVVGKGDDTYDQLITALHTTITVDGYSYPIFFNCPITLKSLKGNSIVSDEDHTIYPVQSWGIFIKDSDNSTIGSITFPPNMNSYTLFKLQSIYDELQVTKNDGDDYYTCSILYKIYSGVLTTDLSWTREEINGTYLFKAQVDGSHDEAPMKVGRAEILVSGYTTNNTSQPEDLADKQVCTGFADNYIYIRDDSCSTVEDFLDTVETLAYEMATPTTYTASDSLTYADISTAIQKDCYLEVSSSFDTFPAGELTVGVNYLALI